MGSSILYNVLHLISSLKDLDKVIRSAVKEMISLPDDIPNDMLYSSKKVRGLGLIKAEWEANIQHFNISKRLSQVSDGHLLLVRNLEEEKKTALKRLKIPEASIAPRTTGIHLRDELRKRSFESWLRSVPGRAFSTTRCRQPGCNETETLGHVLGFCRKGELLRNNRHHRVRGAIACLLRNKGWEVHEEVHCISEDDSHRRADIIAINRHQQKAIIIDPTIRMERDLNQAHQVDQEKRVIYEPYLNLDTGQVRRKDCKAGPRCVASPEVMKLMSHGFIVTHDNHTVNDTNEPLYRSAHDSLAGDEVNGP
ncbi:hypothetical protein ANN_18945 [Periplaneta americana]|uniref:Reverse transcriptase n=1 Tax=Periplaneta americana TaxID=6978 RepID=A0ABQ8SQ52_PERAM|nr:hypothetical protein ANN_18945 [Periplaneta americana]